MFSVFSLIEAHDVNLVSTHLSTQFIIPRKDVDADDRLTIYSMLNGESLTFCRFNGTCDVSNSLWQFEKDWKTGRQSFMPFDQEPSKAQTYI